MKVKESKIWIVSELFYPETISTAYIMFEIAKSLSAEYKVEVICGSLFYETKREDYNISDLPFLVNRINKVNYNKNNIISRLIGNLRISWKMFLLMSKKIPRNSEVLMVSNPVFLVWLTSLIISKKCWKIKLLVHDVFPENINSVKEINSFSKLFLPLLKHAFNNAFSKMNTLILLGRDMKVIFSKKVKNVNIQIIGNWADTENIVPISINKNKCVFIYAGNFGRVQGIGQLLEALKFVKNSKLKFLFVGSGACQNLIDDFIKNGNNNAVEKFPWQPREKQNKFLNDATVGVVSLADGMYGLGVPSKFYNLLAAGKPILYIGPKNSELHLVIKEYKIGWFVEVGNIKNIANTIEDIINTDRYILNTYSVNARKLAETKYTKDLILNKFNKLFHLENID
jgi:glycosyltransferase involved in cell wall biosynthesis